MGGCASKPKVKEGDVATKPLVPVSEKKEDFAAKNTVVEKMLVAADVEDNATKRCHPNNSFTKISMKEELCEPSKSKSQEPNSREEHTQPLVASMDFCSEMTPDSSPKSKEKLAQEIKSLLLQTTLEPEENVAKETLLDIPKIDNSSENYKTEEKQAENTLKPDILYDKGMEQKPIEESIEKIETSNDELEEKHNESLMENEVVDKDVENSLKLEGFPEEKIEQISHNENALRKENLIENTIMDKPTEDTSKHEKEIEENHAQEDTLEPEKNTEEESAQNTLISDGSGEENIPEKKLSLEQKPIQKTNGTSNVIKMEENHEENFAKSETPLEKGEEENMKPQQPETTREKETEAMLLDHILMKEMEEKWIGR